MPSALLHSPGDMAALTRGATSHSSSRHGLSVEFELYLVKEFQRLKAKEQELIGWSAKRELAKINYRIHTDAIKENLIPAPICNRPAERLLKHGKRQKGTEETQGTITLGVAFVSSTIHKLKGKAK